MGNRNRRAIARRLGALAIALALAAACGVDATGVGGSSGGTDGGGSSSGSSGSSGTGSSSGADARDDGNTIVIEGGVDGDTDGGEDGGTDAADAGCLLQTTPGCPCGTICGSGVCSAGGCEPLVFVTSSKMTGNIANNGDPLAAADTICSTLAVGIVRTPATQFRAWLSTSTTSVAARFTQSTRPYHLRDLQGTIVANNFAALGSNLINEINVDENRLPVPNGEFTWTGTDRDGTAVTDTCNDWTSGDDDAIKGGAGHVSQKSTNWSHETEKKCTDQWRLYCFEQLP